MSAQRQYWSRTELADRLPDRPYILFVGALQPHKGLGPLLAAYEQLENPPPLVLIGSVWPETPKQFPPSVTVLHNVPHHVVMAAWERSLFGVAPSVWPDPLPGVVREGMSKGIAMIASNIGGNTDMISDGETGLLHPAGDARALAARLQELIIDPQRRHDLGQAGRARFEREFTVGAMTSRMLAVYGAGGGGAR